MREYKDTAKKLGIKYRIGKYGIVLLPKAPTSMPHKLLSVVPLDGWITDPKAIEHHFRENGFEL